jgi:hypothetical protein
VSTLMEIVAGFPAADAASLARRRLLRDGRGISMSRLMARP